MANFWTDGKIEPKRQNRWVVQFDGIFNGNMFFATKVKRPVATVSKKEHKYLNHTFNYPGRVTWEPITLTLVDTAGGGSDSGYNSMLALMDILSDSGYLVPENAAQLKTISKEKAVNSLSSQTGRVGGGGGANTGTDQGGANGITIKMVDASGQNVIEEWTLRNAFLTKVTPSELSYEDENIATIDLEITFDYCIFNLGKGDKEKFSPGR